MMITVMLQGVLLVIVAIASSRTAAAEGDELQLEEDLDYDGYPPANITDFYKMFEIETSLNERSSVLERLGGGDCQRTSTCIRANGYCVESRSDCAGHIDAGTCKGRGHCKCCVPHVEGLCIPGTSCIISGGHCVKSSGECDGAVDRYGCKGVGCMCCLPRDEDLPWMEYGNDSFVAFTDSINWYDARALCQSNGLQLYHPNNIIGVAEYLTNHTSGQYWLGGKGDGSNMAWFNGEVLTQDGYPWYSSYWSQSYVADNYCLGMWAYSSYWSQGTVLIAQDCITGRYKPLCGH